MNGNSIPKATLGRLPQYLEFLRNLPEGAGETISATTIAKNLSLGEVQVRKDLAIVSGAGKPKIGYITRDLIRDLESWLGTDDLTAAVLIGAGKLGSALYDYDGFEEFGVKIVAAFDCCDQVIRSNTSSKEILPITSLDSFCRENNVKLGIITVGRSSAQEVCDMMVDAGISAIWNFAPCALKVPGTVLLRQENLALSLAYLNNQLSK
jgi:redox-sensing transcriptional repressor